MAYNIKPLRQQNLFDQYGMLSLGDMNMDPGYSYGSENQDVSSKTWEPSPSDMFTSGPDLASLGTKNVNPGSPSDVSRVSSQPNNDDNDIKKMIDSIYSPSHVATDRFNNLLDNPPERNNPSIMRKIVAAGVGLGNKGMGVAPSVDSEEKVLYAPYLRDMAEFTAKTGPFQQAASLENTANINERTLAGNIVNAQTQEKRIAESERSARAREAETLRANQAKEETNLMRERTRQYLAQNPDWKADYSGTTVKVFNPRTHETVDTGMPTDKVSEWDRLYIGGQIKKDIADANNAAAMDRTIQSGANQANVATIQGQNAVTTKSTPGAPTAPKPGDEAKRKQDVLGQLYDTDPIAAKWIIKNDAGQFDLKPRPKVGGGTSLGGIFGTPYTQKDVDDYDKVAAVAHPAVTTVRGVNTGNLGGGNQPPIIQNSPSTGMQRKSTDGGKTWMYSKDGGKTWTGGQ